MIVAGFGFTSTATETDLRAALTRPVDAVATVAAKAPALACLGLPVIAVDVRGRATPTESAHSRATHGTGSVAEASALAALRNARLLGPRTIHGPVTIAYAEGDPA